MLWTIDLLKKSLNDKDNNKNMTSYEKKGSVKILLFDSVPIENYILFIASCRNWYWKQNCLYVF